MPRQKDSLVAEAVEAAYFSAILKTLALGLNARGIAFLIDEFEEIGLQRRLTKRAAHDYLSTLKRLVNVSESGDIEFWVILSMTPDAHDTTVKMDPALAERFALSSISIDQLSAADATRFVRSRIAPARIAAVEDDTGLFPFPGELGFRPLTLSNPRRLVKACFYAIADAKPDTTVPFTKEYLRQIEDSYYLQRRDM